jgi:hypothetical protein|tara:strand:- start:347 stop:733 length:387 start_codon:yes stop_codon:yes gene_type:complete
MRNVFYDSDSLGKSIYIADVQSLRRNDLNVLERELNLAITNMRVKMHEERDTTELDWLHKLSVKLKICEQFMTRIKQVKENDLSKVESYHLSYFRQAVSTLIGPLQTDQLYEKARQDALFQVGKESNS